MINIKALCDSATLWHFNLHDLSIPNMENLTSYLILSCLCLSAAFLFLPFLNWDKKDSSITIF